MTSSDSLDSLLFGDETRTGDELARLSARPFIWSPQAKRMRSLTSALKIGYVATLVGIGMLALFSGLLAWLYTSLMNGAALDETFAAAMEGLAGLAILIGLFVYLTSFLVVIVLHLWFMFRATKNLTLSRAKGIDTSPAWAVGWHFVPFANLWMPFKTMKEIWNASHDPIKGADTAPGRMGWWWGLWILSGVISSISSGLSNNSMGPSGEIENFALYVNTLWIDIASFTCMMIATVLLYTIVGPIARKQDEWAAQARSPQPETD